MKLTKGQRKIRNAVADAIEGNPRSFDITSWHTRLDLGPDTGDGKDTPWRLGCWDDKYATCGTTHCIAGWVEVIAKRHAKWKPEIKLCKVCGRENCDSTESPHYTALRHAANLLGVDSSIFWPLTWQNYVRAYPKLRKMFLSNNRHEACVDPSIVVMFLRSDFQQLGDFFNSLWPVKTKLSPAQEKQTKTKTKTKNKV